MQTQNYYRHLLNEEILFNSQNWRIASGDYKERFVGHCNTTTDIKEANFFGNDANYIIAGWVIPQFVFVFNNF